MARHRTLTLLLTVGLGHILLISAQVQSKSGLPVLQAVGFGIFARVQTMTAATADAVRGAWTGYFALRGAARENEALRQRVVELEAQVQAQQALAARTHSLEEVLGLKAAQPGATVTARVIAGNPSPSAATVTIDRGSSDGVAPDMAVVGARGVVGRVISPVSGHAATVQLLVARNANTAVTFERSGSGGIAAGGLLPGLLRGEYVPALADIQPGERVTTSGQDGIYPPGLPVGTVDHVSGGGLEREIGMRPAVDFSHVDIVLVVLTRPERPDGAKP